MPGWFEWIESNPALVTALAATSAVTFVASLALLPLLVVRLPEDYFAHEDPPELPFARSHPALRLVLCLLKNGVGVLLILAGLAMLVLPGQGILTILAGLTLTAFPGKRRLERALIGVPRVRRAFDWIRRRRGRPPFRVDDDPSRGQPPEPSTDPSPGERESE